MPKLASGQPLRSAERMLDVMASFSVNQPALTISDITTRLSLATSTVRRILDVLERRGFVRQDPLSGRYSPSAEIVRLSAVATVGNDLIAAARQPLDVLRDTVNENVQLTTMVGGLVIFVDRRESNQLIKIFSQTGSRHIPWDGRASGQILLAWLSTKELKELLPTAQEWKPKGAKLPKTRTAFLELLESVRSNGYAINDELTEPDVWAVAAPVRDHTGHVIAAVSVPVLKSRVVDPDRVTELVEATTLAASKISRELHFIA